MFKVTKDARGNYKERWLDGWTDGWAVGQMSMWMAGWLGGWVGRWIDGEMDGYMGGGWLEASLRLAEGTSPEVCPAGAPRTSHLEPHLQAG